MSDLGIAGIVVAGIGGIAGLMLLGLRRAGRRLEQGDGAEPEEPSEE